MTQTGISAQPGRFPSRETLSSSLLAVLLFLVPLFPDVKLARPKLLLLEMGLCLILLILLIIEAGGERPSFRRSVLYAPLAAYGLFVSAYYLLSADRPVASSELARCLFSLAAFFVAANAVRSEKARDTVMAAWLAGTFLAAVYALLQHTGGAFMLAVPRANRVSSTYGNPIFFAAQLVVALPLALGMFFEKKNIAARAALSAFMLAALAALWYTKTRAAYIASAVSLAVFAWQAVRSKKTRLLLLASGAVVFSIFIYADRGLWSRHQEHALIWRDTVVMWTAQPLFGTGPGTFHLYFPRYASDALKKIWPQDRFIVNDAHNEYLQFLSETGMIGFGIFAWLIISFFASSRGKNNDLRRAGLYAAAAGLLAQNLFSVDMRFIVSSVSLFLVMGLSETFEPSYAEFRPSRAARAAAFAGLGVAAFFVFPAVLAPYIAQRHVARAPDFFDQKVLEPAKTIADLEALSLRYPDQALVFEKLGWVCAKEKKWTEAIAAYEKAALLAPDNAGPLNNLGNIYFLLDDRERAVGYWRRSLAVDPGQADSRLNLATAYYYQGKLKEASEQLTEVLKLQPKNEKAVVLLKRMTD